MSGVWRVLLPHGAEPPYRVYVNGVPQREGDDYRVVGQELHFTRRLQREGDLGFWRWAAIFLALFGTYRQDDSVDVQYTLHGKDHVATGLEIIPPGDSGA
jgi:hypothetical protein